MHPEPSHEHRRADPLHLSRRDLLRAAGGLVVASTTLSALTGPAAAADAKRALAALPFSTEPYVSTTPQRFVFVIQRAARNGPDFVGGAAAKLRFESPDGSVSDTIVPRFDRAGLTKGRGVYVTEATFDRPGYWKLIVNTRGKRLTTKFTVVDKPGVVVPGMPAPRAASPTNADPLGVSPLCTRSKECGLHSVSLANVIGSGKPVVAMFATPARCASQYCGPVLDEMLRVMGPYGSRVTFVHVEIYKAASGAQLVPTVDAWKLPSEPWLFAIDGAGTVVARADGAMGGGEIKGLIDRVAA